jgi:hypothetical protein
MTPLSLKESKNRRLETRNLMEISMIKDVLWSYRRRKSRAAGGSRGSSGGFSSEEIISEELPIGTDLVSFGYRRSGPCRGNKFDYHAMVLLGFRIERTTKKKWLLLLSKVVAEHAAG